MTVRLLLLSSLLCASIASAQPQPADMGKRSDVIVANLRKVELVNQILPLVLQKDQIRKLLPAIEKVRDKSRKLLRQEYEDLIRYEGRASDAVAAALKEGRLPQNTFVREIVAFFNASEIRRSVALYENVDIVMPVLKTTLNKGQLKVAANSLPVHYFEPDVKPEEATEELRLRVFIREVILDAHTYDLLIQMSK